MHINKLLPHRALRANITTHVSRNEVIVMNETTILQHLEDIAEKLNLKVNYENLRKLHIFSKGGFYRLQEDHIVLIENTLNLSEKIEILADALGHYDLEDIYMPPAVRKILDRKANTNIPDDSTDSEKPPLPPSDVTEDQGTASP
jgi:hypothetical protein